MNAINDDRATVVIAGFDSHLQMSYVAGLMENTENPISYYLNDRPDPGQATCTIGCRATCREENLDLLSLVNQQVPHLLTAAENEEDRESSATHVVTSVLYGAEVYCILAQDIDADEDAQKEIENNLSLLAGKWSNALSELEDPVIFKKKFNSQEKHLITQLRCRLYAPLQTEPMTECSYLESYAKSFQVMQTLFTFPEDVANSKAVPVVIKLCPLNCILAASKQMAKFSYRDVGYSAVQRYSLLFAKLNRIVLSAENIRRVMQKPCDSESLQQFLDLVFKFQGFLKTNTKQSVVVARNASYSSDAAVHSTLQDAEKHLLFKPSVLNQWLKRKTEEMDIAYWMEKAAGTGIEFLSKDKLENHLRNSLDYSVVLFVPEERTSAILAAMKNCADNLQEFGLCGHEGNDDGQSWYNNPLQKKLVFDKIQQLAAHVERNKNNISKPVNYIVSFSGSSKPLTCSYSVYEGGELLKGKIRRLPGEPTGLSVFSLPVPSANTRQAKRAKTSFSSIRLEWDYELLDYPCSFVVVYRLAGSSDSWVQQKTEQSEVVIDFETGTDVEMLVAAETCIGRSKFSEIVDTTSAVELPDVELDIPSVVLPPTGLEVKLVTSETAEMVYVKCSFFLEYTGF